MADFDKYSNYNEDKSFSSVVFGAEKPVLEVELNEMQQIINTKFARLLRGFRSGIIPLADNSIVFTSSNMTLTIKDCILLEKSLGLTAYIQSAFIVMSTANRRAYFAVQEVDADSNTPLKAYGNTAGSAVTNTMLDSRFPIETTRRKVVTYTLMVSQNVPEDTDTTKYVLVGSYISSVFTPVKWGLENPEFTGSVSMGRKPNTTVGTNSTALGAENTASGEDSVALGRYTKALNNQVVMGAHNDETIATANELSGASTGTAFVIGNGTSSAKSNAFRVQGDGVVYAKGAYNATGADYAEYAEWADGNPDNEDRRGYFVTFDEEKPNMIRKANTDDVDILGVVSGNPCIIGNSDECWLNKNLFDEFGSPIYETVEETIEVENEETGEVETRTILVTQHKVNPDYDPTQEYVHRRDRKEWSAVGWIGVLAVREDGTCKVGGYCTWNDEGIATSAPPSRFNYRILERVSDNIVKIALK